MGRRNKPRRFYKHSTGKRLCYVVTMLCLMVPLLIGFLILLLALIPILCVSPALWTGWKLAQVSMRLLRDMVWELKAQPYRMHSGKEEKTSRQKNSQDMEITV